LTGFPLPLGIGFASFSSLSSARTRTRFPRSKKRELVEVVDGKEGCLVIGEKAFYNEERLGVLVVCVTSRG